MTTDIITKYENNIEGHYVKYIERFVNVYFHQRVIVELIDRFYNKKMISKDTN